MAMDRDNFVGLLGESDAAEEEVRGYGLHEGEGPKPSQ